MSQPTGTVSFFFDDADIFEVAQTVFGEVLRVNYIIDPKVKGRVNFRTVAPIPREEVLPVMETIFRLNGIGFVLEKGIYRIVPMSEVPGELAYAQVGKEPEHVAMELFTFRNVNTKDALREIETAIGLNFSGGTSRIMPIHRLNAILVVASTKEHMNYIRKWISAFDDMFAVARPKIFVYPIQNSKAAHIASLLQTIFSGSAASAATSIPTATPSQKTDTAKPASSGAAVSATPAQTAPAQQPPKTGPAATATGTGFLVSPDTKVFADEITNSLVVVSTPADYEFIAETVKKLDVLPRQVMIEALIAEVTLSDSMIFGLEWSLKTDINMRPFDRDWNLSGDAAAKYGIDTSKGGFTIIGTDPSGIVRATLQALAGEDKVRVLSSPHILVSDNREAKIQIGDQVPIATSQTTNTGTTPSQTTTTIQYKDTGTILKVKPQVNEGGLVSLEITQEVSDFSTKTLFGSDQIIINKREAATNLVAQDGQTIVIGGLIRDKTTRSKAGIPLLSQIPVLGYLFGKTTDEENRTELIILLTPRVIRNQQDAKDVTSDYVERLKGVSKEMLGNTSVDNAHKDPISARESKKE
jgi:general secretion pathway protein D